MNTSSARQDVRGNQPSSVAPQDTRPVFGCSEGPETPEEMDRELQMLEARDKQVHPSAVN